MVEEEKKFMELSSSIIDMVEEAVEKQHPELNLHTEVAKEAGIDEPAVITGEAYYSLEDAVTEQIKEFMKKM